MKDEIRWSLEPADPRTFTGQAASRLVAGAERGVDVKAYYVRFEAGARTNWHVHAGTQILIVTQGVCRYQREHGPAVEIEAGTSVRFEGGERHWHGAGPDEAAAHLAINLENRETVWQEPVTDEQYWGR